MKKYQLFRENIFAEAIINASSERVWSIITDFDQYEAWNIPILILGKCVKGTRLKIQANVPGRKPTVFNGRLLACREMEKLEWKGYTIASFIFTGLHSFEIIPLNDNQVKFVNKESFSGLAIPFLRKNLLRTKIKDFHNDTNLAIKRISELVS
jgi:hypothetical protein